MLFKQKLGQSNVTSLPVALHEDYSESASSAPKGLGLDADWQLKQETLKEGKL